MTHQLGWKSWAAGAVVLVAVTACTNGGDPDPAPTTPSSAPSGPSPSSSPTSASDAAERNATELMLRYFDSLDAARTDPSSSLAVLKSVAAGIQLTAQTNLISSERKNGWHQTGATIVADSQVQSVSLENSEPSTGKAPTVVIDVCWDVSGADVVDSSGKSVVKPGRPDRGWTRYSVVNYRYEADPTEGWRVATGRDLKQEPCAAS